MSKLAWAELKASLSNLARPVSRNNAEDVAQHGTALAWLMRGPRFDTHTHNLNFPV